MKLLRKHLVSLLLILLAIIVVSLTIFSEKKVQAQYNCYDPCNPYCWGT
jgi:hypothetical protein